MMNRVFSVSTEYLKVAFKIRLTFRSDLNCIIFVLQESEGVKYVLLC